MAIPETNDFEIGDVENFSRNKDQQFSHSLLIMTAMRKVLEFGSKELREGWFNTRRSADGSMIQTYVEDTRKAFIESIKTCMMIMNCDADETANEKIEELLTSIQEKKQELIKLNDESWDNLKPHEKIVYSKNNERHIHGKISHSLLRNELIEYEIEIYREIFTELSDLTKRLDFYKTEAFEA